MLIEKKNYLHGNDWAEWKSTQKLERNLFIANNQIIDAYLILNKLLSRPFTPIQKLLNNWGTVSQLSSSDKDLNLSVWL